MSVREKFAYNYLMFRFPIEYLLLIVPAMVGILVNIFFVPEQESIEINKESLDNYIFMKTDTILIYQEVSIIIMLAFFICYRWSSVQADKSYGFWMTLGIKRRKYYMLSMSKFLTIIYSSVFLSILIIIYISRITFDLDIFFKLILLALSNVLLLITLAFLFGTVITNPELAAILYMTILITNVFAITNEDSIIHLLFRPLLHYKLDDGWIGLAISIILAVITFFIGLKLHERMDIEV
ncbi:MAG: hypothetical protein INQ03_03375 [Candidatus Heimdallarchaeota archaeon]|nr:hypothetical protein [Candidatus Heimdallarchaeota archaeon]